MSDEIIESLLEAIKGKAEQLRDELQSKVIFLEEVNDKCDRLLDILVDIENEIQPTKGK